jgi:SAM-dependent methyltransferase
MTEVKRPDSGSDPTLAHDEHRAARPEAASDAKVQRPLAQGKPSIFQRVTSRYTEYLASSVSTEIAECDDMLGIDGMAHYMSVGRSAVDICAQAMILSRRVGFKRVLDLPCGGGRVTRHIAAFLPDAELFAADIDRAKQDFVVRSFGAKPVSVAADFSSAVADRFDLIFVGSLLTHLGTGDFERALRWYIDSLAPEGVLIFTTHGRTAIHLAQMRRDFSMWGAIRRYDREGFGFAFAGRESADGLSISYGTSCTKPSWLMALVENDPALSILGFQEGAWDSNHDVTILQKKPLSRTP